MNYQKTVIAPPNDYDPYEHHTAFVQEFSTMSRRRDPRRVNWLAVAVWGSLILAVGGWVAR